MTETHLPHTVLAAALLILLGSSGTAQAAGKPTGETRKGAQAGSIGWNTERVSEQTAPAGLTADGSRKVMILSGDGDVVGELSISHFSGGTVTTVMGGFRGAESVSPTLKVYGQFLVGLLHDVTNDFAAQPGVGVDVAINPRFDLRIRADFPIDFFSGGHQTGTRFGVGVAVPIGPQ